MDPETAKLFQNKPVEITFTDNFVLHGKIRSVDNNGIVLETTQKTSYVCFSRIATIILED